MKKEDKASQWVPANIPVTSINLDKRNLRIAWMEDRQMSQSTLIKIFWDNYNIREIIKSIEINGFFKHEVPVVIKDSEQEGRYVVVEGNRRLAALKIIQNPDFEFIQPVQKKMLTNIPIRIKDETEIIPVIIAPSWESCLPVMVLKHTSEDHSSWKTLMQDYLHWSYLQENPEITTDAAAAHFNMTAAKFNEHVRRYNLFRMIQGVEGLAPEVQNTAMDAKTIPITTFERIVNNRKVAEYLNLPDNWTYEDAEQITHFNDSMRGIITDIINKEETSRSLNTKTEIEKFFFKHNPKSASVPSSVNLQEPPETGVVPAAGDTNGAFKNSPNNQTGSEQTKQTRSSRSTKSIMRTKIPFGLKNASALKKIYDELYELRVDSKPNASVALFRVFLDKATRKLLERKGFKKCPIINKSGDSTNEKPFTKVSFGECLEFISSSKCDLVTDSVKKALRFFLGKGEPEDSLSKSKLSGMNQLIHNHEINYNPEEAKNLWPQLESYVKILLKE